MRRRCNSVRVCEDKRADKLIKYSFIAPGVCAINKVDPHISTPAPDIEIRSFNTEVALQKMKGRGASTGTRSNPLIENQCAKAFYKIPNEGFLLSLGLRRMLSLFAKP